MCATVVKHFAGYEANGVYEGTVIGYSNSTVIIDMGEGRNRRWLAHRTEWNGDDFHISFHWGPSSHDLEEIS